MITCLTPNAQAVARGERDGTLSVYQIANSQIHWSKVVHTGPITMLAYSPDGAWLASGGRDGMVHIFQAASGVCCATLTHGRAVQRLEWSPNSRSLCIASGQSVDLLRLTPVDTNSLS